VELETAAQKSVRIYCFQKILNDIKADTQSFDLIILNNDLTTGIPEILKEADIPIYPSIQAGWHSRLKSHHFKFTAEIVQEFSRIIGLDPWLLSTLHRVADPININEPSNQQKLMDQTSDLFRRIRDKYQEHHIPEKPFIFIKADSGTYGMGVMAIEDPSDFINLNRKDKNKLYKGKGAQVIHRYLLQEGVPTIYNIDHEVSEVCIYQIDNNLVGGFYRSHPQKTERDNLNTQGMDFKKMCPHLKKYGDCGIHHDMNIFDIYRILARIAGIAAHREIVQLEHEKK
jgi:glutamate--cysteine ligase